MTSSQAQDPHLTIAYEDIFKIFNWLVKLKDRLGCVEGGLDPIVSLLEALDAQEIPLSQQKICASSRARINLKLKCRLLVEHSQLVKCNDCSAPVTSLMISEELFAQAYEGGMGGWTCENCKVINIG